MVAHLERLCHAVTGFEWGERLPEIQNYNRVIHLGAISSTTERNVEKVIAQN